MSFQVRDAAVSPAAFALAAAAGSTVSASIDTGNAGVGDFLAKCELLITAPALNATQAPDTRTVTYIIEDSADNSSFAAALGVSQLVQTGAGGVGAAAATKRLRLPTNIRRYVRLKVTTGASTGDCSGVNAQLDLLF